LIRENLRDIKNDLQETQAETKKQLKETEIKQLIENNLYIYFLNNKNNIAEFETIEKKEETKNKICEILRNENIEDFKIKAFLNKNYNKILKLVKTDLKAETETAKECTQRVLNNRFNDIEDIEKTYNALKIIKNRDLICDSIIKQNKNINKNDLIEYMQKNYYRDLNAIYKMHKEDKNAKEYFDTKTQKTEKQENKKSGNFWKITGKICAVFLLSVGWIFLIITAALFGFLKRRFRW